MGEAWGKHGGSMGEAGGSKSKQFPVKNRRYEHTKDIEMSTISSKQEFAEIDVRY